LRNMLSRLQLQGFVSARASWRGGPNQNSLHRTELVTKHAPAARVQRSCSAARPACT